MDFIKIKPAGRSCSTGILAVTTRKNLLKLFQTNPPKPDICNRTDEIANHMIKKTIAMKPKFQQMVWPLLKNRFIHRTYGAHRRTAGCTKRTEIMRPPDTIQCLSHTEKIERSSLMPYIARTKGIRRFPLLHAIKIDLGGSTVPRRKVRICFSGRFDDNIGRQQTVDSPDNTADRNGSICEEINDLPIGMYTGIRPASGSQLNRIPEHQL